MKTLSLLTVSLFVWNSPAFADTYPINEPLRADLLTKEMKNEENTKAGQRRLGIDLASARNGAAFINLTMKGNPHHDAMTFTELTGNGVLTVGSGTYPFSLIQGQSLKIAKLSNGHAILYGQLDATIKDKTGDSILEIGLAYDVDAKTAQVSAVDGDMATGYAPMYFGDLPSDTPMDELSKLFRE